MGPDVLIKLKIKFKGFGVGSLQDLYKNTYSVLQKHLWAIYSDVDSENIEVDPISMEIKWETDDE